MKPSLAGVHHITPMLSLDCTYDPQAVIAWVRSVGCAVVAEPKLDGVAASARYVDGNLESVATRGDGITGRDITDRVQCLVPAATRERGVFEVRGELVIPKCHWHSADTREGIRTRVAYLLRSRSIWDAQSAGVAFLAYDVVGDCDLISSEFRTPNAEEFPCDGIVFKVDSRQDRERLGATRRSPRWAIAYKGEASALHGLHDLAGIPIPSVQL